MVVKHQSFRSYRALPALLAAACLAACMPEASPGPAGPVAGSGGSSGQGGTAGRGGSGGTSGSSAGAGGSSAGAGGSTTGAGGSSTGAGGGGAGSGGQAGRGGSGAAGADAGGGSGMADAGSPADAATDAAYSPILGYGICVPCHGPEGAGVPEMGPEIQHPVIDFSTWVVRNGRMHPAFKLPMLKYGPDVLPDAQLQGIFAFLASRPKPTTGAGLYKDYCENCHGADGKGGVTMRDISAAPVADFISDSRAGHHPGEFSNRREYMPKWTAAELSDAELRLIFMHVDGL
jgi:mono/diheme cytochrome c family protein